MVHPKRQELLAEKHAEFIRAFSEVCKPLVPPVDVGDPCCRRRSTLQAVRAAAQPRSLHSPPPFFLQNKESFEFYATEHFRMSGVYWGLTALHLLGRLDLLDREAVVAWVLACQRECGGFGGSERHDPHLLYTLSALQILALYDELHRVDADAVARCECAGRYGAVLLRGCTHLQRPLPSAPDRHLSLMAPLPGPACAVVAGLQQPDGSFWGDAWGETDTRFSYCALSALWLLDRLPAVDVQRAALYVAACKNFDGGFGCTPGSGGGAAVVSAAS